MIWEKQANDLNYIVEPITVDLTIDVTISNIADHILDKMNWPIHFVGPLDGGICCV